MNSTYHFTPNDCQLHIRERLWDTPPVEMRERTESYSRLAIQNREFFWPKALSMAGLEWLYNEVFLPWAENPASYAHPQTSVPIGGWVIDAGACEGFFSMFALEHGAGYVLAVEPVSELGAALTFTFAQSKYRGRIDILRSALASEVGTLFLQADSNQIWNSNVLHCNSNANTVRVWTTTIDELVKTNGLTDSGLIKMDIEGGEMAALQGAIFTLKEYKPHLAIAVYHGYENAVRCREIILSANPGYCVEFRGMYAWLSPPRPYLLFAW